MISLQKCPFINNEYQERTKNKIYSQPPLPCFQMKKILKTSLTVGTHHFPWICTKNFNFLLKEKKQKPLAKFDPLTLGKETESNNKGTKVKYLDSNTYLVSAHLSEDICFSQQMPMI